MLELELRLPAVRSRAVPVRVGAGALDLLVRALKLEGTRQVVVVSDSNVAPLHGEALGRALRDAGIGTTLVDFPAGERHKTRETKSAIEDRLLAAGADRRTVLVALGGGVTGDLTGFVAATWHRGIAYVQAPTSLLAMVDAAIGGKSSVDLPGGKNLVGAFHQPAGVYADLSVLATLPRQELAAGFAEAVKAAVVADARLFGSIERQRPALAAGDPGALETIVGPALRIKAGIVARDERDLGPRKALNFGHTVAHALEAASGYAIPHGRAVAIGMVVESGIACDATGFPRRDADRVATLLGELGIDAAWPEGIEVRAVRDAMGRDKKNIGGAVRFALPARIGRMPPGPDVTVEIEEGRLRSALDKAAARATMSS